MTEGSEPPAPPPGVVASFPLFNAGAIVQAAARRSADLVAFGLRAAETASPDDLSIPGSAHQMASAAGAERPNVEDVRRAFRAWVLSNGLRECVEAIGPALERARTACFLFTRPRLASREAAGQLTVHVDLSGDVWNKELVGGAKKFDRLPLPDKLKHLEERYGFRRPPTADAVLSINAARNCLSHRGGVVGPADLKVPGDAGLRVQWLRAALGLIMESGETQRIEITPDPVSLQGATHGRMEIIPVEREFPLGSRVEFTAAEYGELCMTFSVFGAEIGAAVRELATQGRGGAAPSK